jgi:hypothetical protein
VLRRELTRARIVDQRADEICGEQVGRELQPLETSADAARERLNGERLRQPGHALEQDVAIREQADEQSIDQIFLPDDDAGDFILQSADPLARLLYLLGEFLSAGHEEA